MLNGKIKKKNHIRIKLKTKQITVEKNNYQFWYKK